MTAARWGRSVITVSELGEFGLIKRVTAGLAPVASTLLGPGDDAAVVAAPDGRVVATTDLLIENRHFRRDWSTANDIGHKAAARNFADIVAMGAVPTALLVGFAAPARSRSTGWTAWSPACARSAARSARPSSAATSPPPT